MNRGMFDLVCPMILNPQEEVHRRGIESRAIILGSAWPTESHLWEQNPHVPFQELHASVCPHHPLRSFSGKQRAKPHIMVPLSAHAECPFPEADPAGCPVREADPIQSPAGSFCPLEAAGHKRAVHKMMLARCHLPQRRPAPAHP